MLGFHPFSTQAFSSAVPFVDVQVTTNLVNTNMGSGIPVSIPLLASTNLALTLASTASIPTVIMTPTGVALSAAINSVAPFTWAAVSDTSNQTWTQVDDTTNQEWSEV